MKRVSMNLTERDVRNTEKLQRKLHTRSKADAVSTALSIAASITDQVDKGSQLLIKKRSGETERLIITGLD